MDINDLFEGIMKVINQFADEVAAEWVQEKMPVTGRDPESKGEKMENFPAGERRSETDFPKQE